MPRINPQELDQKLEALCQQYPNGAYFTQPQLAQLLNCGRSTIGGIENRAFNKLKWNRLLHQHWKESE